MLSSGQAPAESILHVGADRWPPGQKVVLYDYHPSRSGQVPLRLLEGYTVIAGRDGITQLCCLAHARRKFVEAQRVQPKGKTKTGKAEIALDFIGRLYGDERRVQDADTETRYRARQTHSVPILQQLRLWLERPCTARHRRASWVKPCCTWTSIGTD